MLHGSEFLKVLLDPVAVPALARRVARDTAMSGVVPVAY
jgi:hypothetical protein